MRSARYCRVAVLAATLVASQASQATDNLIFWNDFDSSDCPAGRITSSSLLYYSALGMPTADNVDMTEWESIWGRALPGGDIEYWPGQDSVTVVVLDFVRTGYIAAHFNVPDGAEYNGTLNHGTYLAGAGLTAAISTACGDFTHVEPRCQRQAGAGETLARWRTTDSAGQCTLGPGDYYVNIKLTDPEQQVAGCGNSQCEENIQSYWGSN